MAVTWITSDDLATPLDPRAPDAAEAASWLLYRLSGEKYGGIRTAVEWYGYDQATCWCLPELIDGIWVSASLHRHSVLSPYGQRSEPRRLRLRHSPVGRVNSVTLADGVLDPAEYLIANDAYLVRLNNQHWQFERGVEVSYSYGVMPPVMGRQAAIQLGNQFLLAYIGSDECSLPERVRDVSRQGVSLTILDPQDFLTKGRTGIYEVDLFLSAANPSGARKRARVFSPDIPSGERRR